MTEPDTEVVEEYAHGCRIVREPVERGEDRYYYEGPLGRMKSFHSVDHARIYADVHTVTGGFREEKTGERGVPPAIAHAREDVLAAYLVSNPTMGLSWTARFFDEEKDVIRDYVQMVQRKAENKREAANELSDRAVGEIDDGP